VRKLGRKNEDEWREYRSSDRKPADIPAAPDDVYAEVGWAGYGDWLGTAMLPLLYGNTNLSTKPERSHAALG
jgi:hypothetical protein